jgi:hypothetical protein
MASANFLTVTPLAPAGSSMSNIAGVLESGGIVGEMGETLAILHGGAMPAIVSA